MNRILNKAFDNAYYKQLIQEVPFHKLTYKHSLAERTKDGEITYYGILHRDFKQKSYIN